MFNIDFNKLITWLLPPLLRQPVFYGWIRALCGGAINMYGLFMTNRTAHLYELNHDSRVFSMEAVFNDAFDPVNRTIYITDGFNKNRLYIYLRAELEPVYLNPAIYLYNPGDYDDTGIDFIVWVPNAVLLSATGLIQLTALVNAYKLASKRYAIYRVTLPPIR